MTNEEAKRNVNAYIIAECTNIPYHVVESLEVFMKANDKQMPLKVIDKSHIEPIYDSDGCQVDGLFMLRAECPVCQNLLCDCEWDVGDKPEEFMWNYCEKCGQALDWSDTYD